MPSPPLLRVLFLCRGSTRDGLGHIMRSRSVAQETARRASVRLVAVGDSFCEPLLSERGLRYEIAPDEQAAADAVLRFAPHVVVFDALQFSPHWVSQIKQQALAVSLSPVFNCLAEMDLVFHRTACVGDDWQFADGGPQLRSSLEYAVVRENCSRIPEEDYRRNLAQDPLSIVVSMGGADAGNKTLQVLDAITHVASPLLIWVLLGEGYTHSYQALVDCVKNSARHEIILAKTSESMWRVMRTCSLAVLAGGTITYEAVYAGLPSINVFESEHHMFLVRELVERGVCLSVGYPVQDALDVVTANIAYLEKHRQQLLEMHLHAQGLVDGQASRRIAREIGEFYWSVFLPANPTRCPDPPHLAKWSAAHVAARVA